MQNLILDAVALPQKPQSRLWNKVNKYLSEAYLRRSSGRSACSIEQRNNLYLLADQTLAFAVEGDLVELGCHDGSTARVIASVLMHHQAERVFHVYDYFRYDWTGAGGVRERLERNFRKSGLPLPSVHDGELNELLPGRLPDKIAFAHVHCSVGDLPEHHGRRVLACLEALYPRMSPGAIGVMMDYHDPERTVGGWNCNPGVKLACDRFFKQRPECMQILYGDQYSHAFFRKVW